MAIDGEPKNGDYVRYIEQLINRGQAAPGQVVAKTRDALPTPAVTPSPGEVVPHKTKSPRAPGATQSTSDGPVATPLGRPDSGATAADATLATRAAKRRAAWAVALVSLAVAWQAVRMLLESLRRPDFDSHELVPVVFLLIFAGILWRAARGQREKAKQPPGRLPPLTTISGKGKAGI